MGEMNRISVLVYCILILLSNSVCFNTDPRWEAYAVNDHPVHNIDTGLDYATIQEVIDAPETLDGHTILVDAGTYYENVLVNKAVSLIGESQHTTTVNGSGDSTCFRVTVDNVSISNFKITGARWAGIYLMFNGTTDRGANNCTIANNTITRNDDGIGIYVDIDSDYSTIEYNNITYNSPNGILLNGGYSYIRGNYLSKNYRAIRIEGSDENVLRNNTLMDSDGFDLSIIGRHLSAFMHDIDTSNTIDGRPIYYLLNQHCVEINASTLPDLGFLGLVNSTDIVVEDMVMDGVDTLFAYVSNSTLQNMVIENSSRLRLMLSTNNVIRRNVIVNNKNGIVFDDCSSNIVVENIIENSQFSGIGALLSSGNFIYRNNFINNSVQVICTQNNVWDDGYPSGGNYWSDYAGSDGDGDGIGDTPYIIDENDRDRYPLMDPLIHDVAITEVTPDEFSAWRFGKLSISVTVENYGFYPETFVVTLKANTITIGNQTVVNLEPATTKTLTFTWDIGFVLGDYWITATATAAPGETKTSDNTYTDGKVHVSPGGTFCNFQPLYIGPS
jgi:parallel beta-helix repeat protein